MAAYEAWTVEWDMPIVADDRMNRYAYSTWGGKWETPVGGTADNYNADGARGTILIPTGDTAGRSLLLPGSFADIDAVVTIRVSQVATGANINGQIRFRSVDSSNFYLGSAAFDTTGNVDVSINRLLGGSGSVLVSAANVVAYTAGADIHLWVQARGDLLRAKAWSGDRDNPPDTWDAEWNDTNFPTGQVGARATITGGNTNVNPVVSFDDWYITVPERWVDITPYVDTTRGGAQSGGSPFTVAAGDTAEASTDTGGFGLPLLNADQRFTPGNVLSPYAPNIAPGSRIRVYETILDQRFDRATGYVQYPEIQAWTESNEDSPRDQMIVIPVVDRAAWIAQGRKCVSTLAEHIIYHGGPSLVAYWPMGELEGPDVNPVVGAPWTITQTKRYNGYALAPTAGAASITYGSPGTAPADDLSAITFSPSTTQTPAPDYVTSLMLTGARPTPLTLEAGQALTVVGWTRPGQLLAGATSFSIVEVGTGDPGFPAVEFVSIYQQSGTLIAQATRNDWYGTLTGPPAPSDHSMPVAIRVSFSPAVLELWVRGEVYTGTLTVNSATSWTFDDMNVAERYPGAVNHAQVYLGDPDDWTHDDFVAQHEMGLYGGERQSTGERIRTVLQYAGVDPSELGRIDDGVSRMQVARMAGRNPMDLVAEAVETEQGEFHIAGDNRPVFADRVRLYNI